jgi:hypothetical protein
MHCKSAGTMRLRKNWFGTMILAYWMMAIKEKVAQRSVLLPCTKRKLSKTSEAGQTFR